MRSELLGHYGEVKAAGFLRKNGWQIITGNFHSRFGEIDIIAIDKTYILFVEVKLRRQDSLYRGIEAVTYSKQQKIKKTANFFLSQHSFSLQPRFDVIEIVTDKENEVLSIELFENAF